MGRKVADILRRAVVAMARLRRVAGTDRLRKAVAMEVRLRKVVGILPKAAVMADLPKAAADLHLKAAAGLSSD